MGYTKVNLPSGPQRSFDVCMVETSYDTLHVNESEEEWKFQASDILCAGWNVYRFFFGVR